MFGLKTNILFKLFIFIERIFSQLFFPYSMIMFWGNDNYNFWLFFLSIPTFFSIMQISIFEPIRNELSIKKDENDTTKLNVIYQNSLFINLFNILILLLFLYLYFFFNYDDIIIKNNYTIFFLVSINSIIPFLNSPLIMLLTYKGNLKKSISINIFFNILVTIIIPTSYFFLEKFDEVFYILLIINLLKLLFLYKNVEDDKINKNLNIKLFNINEIVRIFKFSVGFNFEIISNILKGPGLIFLLGSLNFINSLALIQTLKILFYYFPIQIYNIFQYPLIIEFNNRFKSSYFKKDDKLKFSILIFILFLILIICYFINDLVGVYVYELWLNKKFEISKKLVQLIFLDSLIFIFSSFILLPLKSINKYNLIGAIDLFFNILILIIIYILHLYNNLLLMFEVILLISIINSVCKNIVGILIIKNNKL